MVQCAKCATRFEGRYCPDCGAPADAAAEKPFTRREYSANVPPAVTAEPVPGVPSNWASVICYVVLIVGPVVFLFLAPYNRDRKIRFDAYQALFLHIAWILIRVIIIAAVNPVAWRLGDLLWNVCALAYLAVIIVMAIKAYQSEKLVLPVIGPLAEKQA